MRKYFFVLVLAVVVVLTVTACGGSKENGGAEPGSEPGVVEDEPVITTGEWYFVDGEFHKLNNDLSFITHFKEFEITNYDSFWSENCYVHFHSKHLGDDTVYGTKTGHFAITLSEEEDGEKKNEEYFEVWYTETGELVQGGQGEKEGEIAIEPDSYTLAEWADDMIYDTNLLFFLGFHEPVEDAERYIDLFTDPEVFAGSNYVINEVSSQKRDFGAGKVTVYHYDYAFSDLYKRFIIEIAKIGDKYMFVHSRDMDSSGATELEFTVTRAVPLK